MFNNVYRNRRVLVTGHTGFKGSWLVLWLNLLGARVEGLSMPPLGGAPNHWDLLGLDIESHYVDIRNEKLLRQKMADIQPEIVFHLAAQSLVQYSYHHPLETWGTNVMGTANLLDASRQIKNLAGLLIVTTDKCYENKGWSWGYRENDHLGGKDPYSASKAAVELLVASYRQSCFNKPDSPLLATARAGNVIGGGDWSEDRLIPNLVRAIETGCSLEVRLPHATRPWQHVLESLSGYLVLGQKLLEGNKSVAEAWNFGPALEGNREVREVLEAYKVHWPSLKWHIHQTQLLESVLLNLDSTKARRELSWQPVWTFEECVAETSEWYKAWLTGRDLLSMSQLENYIRVAQDRGIAWAGNLAPPSLSRTEALHIQKSVT